MDNCLFYVTVSNGDIKGNEWYDNYSFYCEASYPTFKWLLLEAIAFLLSTETRIVRTTNITKKIKWILYLLLDYLYLDINQKLALKFSMWLLWLPIGFSFRQGIERKVWITGGIVSNTQIDLQLCHMVFEYTINTSKNYIKYDLKFRYSVSLHNSNEYHYD